MTIERKVVPYKEWNIYVEHHFFGHEKESIILVNGAMSTTAAFRNTVKNLSGDFNLILFDLPFIGESSQHNDSARIITKSDEADILLHLVNTMMPEYLISISWGGLSSMLALSKQPPSLKKAVIASFSTHMNDKMRDYVQQARQHILRKDFKAAATLLNDEVGKFLPPLLKHINLRHLSSMSDFVFEQVCFHIEQVLALKKEYYEQEFGEIDAELLFMNGDKDEYTTADDVKHMERYVRHCQFLRIDNAGHFLDLESRQTAKRVSAGITGFLAG